MHVGEGLTDFLSSISLPFTVPASTSEETIFLFHLSEPRTRHALGLFPFHFGFALAHGYVLGKEGQNYMCTRTALCRCAGSCEGYVCIYARGPVQWTSWLRCILCDCVMCVGGRVKPTRLAASLGGKEV